MTPLSLLELLALGNYMPREWCDLAHGLRDGQPDVFPLLFRWLEFVQAPPRELVLHFLVPLEWRDIRHELVVMPWSGNADTYGAGHQLVISGVDLAYFRLYQVVPGLRLPQPLQTGHPHLKLGLRQAG